VLNALESFQTEIAAFIQMRFSPVWKVTIIVREGLSVNWIGGHKTVFLRNDSMAG
jgi:hypothetical protein